MKYILKKEYPGSPKLGNTIDNLENDWIENYPEFWKLVVEKDYEILSFYNKEGKCYYNITTHGYYYSELASSRSFTYCLLYYQIHSVKRLSDGEIFTIGDKVVGYNNSIAKIKTIDLVGEISLNIGTDKREGFSLKNLKKVKQPLFTTEDGVDIFKGDKYYYINSNFNNPWEVVNTKADCPDIINKNDLSYKRFSTKGKAEEYIVLNKPCLSIQEIRELLLSAGVGLSSRKEKQLEDLVKSKIQQSV